MTSHALALALLLPAAGLAQLQLSQFDGVTEHPVAGVYDLGKVNTGDVVETRFRIRNTGTSAVPITALSLNGTAFSLTAAPSLGSTLAAGAFVEFRVTFAPAAAGDYSATLIVNTISVILRGTAVQAAVAQLQLSQFDGVTEHPVANGGVYDVGSVFTGGAIDTRFRVRNTGPSAVILTNLSVTGTAFSLAAAPSLGTTLGSGAFVEFRVTFAPVAVGAYSATLIVNTISVMLRGTAVQLQLSQFDGVNEHPITGVYDVGNVSLGDTVDTRFHVRNTGPAAVLLTALSVTGTGFSLATTAPSLGGTLAPGAFFEFRVTFTPPAVGAYTATLMVNTISAMVRGAAVPLAVVLVEGSSTALAAGETVDFGNVEWGSSRVRKFTLLNQSEIAISVASLAVTGTGFRGPISVTAPVPIAAGQSVSFQIAFEPQTPQPAQGMLAVDQRSFKLTGHGFDPPLPVASIAFDSATLTSARQAKVSIPLAAPSKVSGTGTLTLQFQSGVPGVADDPAVHFISGGRVATLTVNIGDTVAHFGTQSDMTFQTGTTAGTLVFALQLPGEANQASMVVTPTAVSLDSSSGVRRTSDVDVSLTGFDNTRSVSTLAFTFFDSAGRTIQPGVLKVDASADFQRYFQPGSAGGMFALRATFPVSGDATQVVGVEVEITNSAGVTRTQRLAF